MKRIKPISILCLYVLVSVMPTIAQNIIRPKISGPNNTWVNSYNGVLYFGRTDMETRNSAMPMQLRFYYNSSSNEVNYGYGRGFSLGYQMRYELLGDELVAIVSGDGRSDEYTRYGKEYQAPAGVFSTLTKNDEGLFVLTEKTGEQYIFGDTAYHQVTKMYDRYGNCTDLSYQDSLLVRIVDAVGHAVELTYNDDGLLASTKASFQQGGYTYEYDASHQLRRVVDPLGNTILYSYTRDGRMNEITDANGNKTIIGYNNAGMVSRLKTSVSDKSIRYDGDKTIFIDYTEPSNQYSYYRWDSKGRAIEKVGLCCGIQSALEYDIYDNVIKRTDANGNATEYTYDKKGNMLSLTDALGYTEQYTYEDIYNQVTSFVDKNGNSYQFVYDAHGNMTSLSGPLGFTNSYTYNDKGWLLTTTDANGNVTSTTYNPDGTMAKQMDAAGYVTAYGYDKYGNITSITDARNHTTTFAYDALGRLTSQTDALGHTTTVSYDKVGNIVRVMNAKNQITAYTYDALGNVLTQTNPMGGVYTYTYDGKGNVLSVKDPIGNTQTFAWNEHNKLLSQTNAEGESTSYEYDTKGNLTAVFQPNGNVLNYFYDVLDRIEQVSDNMGIIARYTYDGNGNQLTVTDGLDRTVIYTYDALNRKVSEALPSGATTRYQYDNNSNLLSVTDALNHVTQYTYSSLNQQLTHTDALNAVTRFEYDANGNLVKATDANGNATNYMYDALNQNTVITFANGLSLQYTYDELGNVVTSKDRAGRESRYTYNALGNLLTKTYPDGTTDKYTYDGISRMLSAINKDATVKFTYDKADRLLSESLNGMVTAYSYDVAAGKRTMTYPSGMKVEEHLNARDLITSILQNGEEMVTMAYNMAGQKTQQVYANGITTDYGYNENGWLQSIQADHNIMSLAYTYDAIGNITRRTDLLNDERTENYGYDAISQLVSFTRGTSVNKSYEFDLLGNRVRTVENGVVTNYACNNVNAYTNITGGLSFTPQYDDNGNMLNDDKHTYAYDFNNKLVNVDQTVGTYKYDALGRRIAKNKTLFYYVGDQMVEEFRGNTIKASYLYGNNIDEVLLMSRNDNVFYSHINHLSSTMALTNAENKLVERIGYDVYGEPTFLDTNDTEIDVSNIGYNLLFSGREYDSESGMYYFRARYMHPNIGRFTQYDALLYQDGYNALSYVKNRTTNYVDRDGNAAAVAIAATTLGPAWGVALAEPTPFGEMAVGAASAGLALYLMLKPPAYIPYTGAGSTTGYGNNNNNNDKCDKCKELAKKIKEFNKNHSCFDPAANKELERMMQQYKNWGCDKCQ